MPSSASFFRYTHTCMSSRQYTREFPVLSIFISNMFMTREVPSEFTVNSHAYNWSDVKASVCMVSLCKVANTSCKVEQYCLEVYPNALY